MKERITLAEYYEKVCNTPSKWEFAKSKSNWHFDYQARDPHPTFRIVGRVQCLPSIPELKSLKLISPGNTLTSPGHDAVKSEIADLERWGYPNWGYDAYEAPPKLLDLPLKLGIENASLRVNKQSVGQCVLTHIDRCTGLLKELMKSPELRNVPVDPDSGVPMNKSAVRLLLMLTDWEPGQFMLFGNSPFIQWKSGDLLWFDWLNVPHSTSNASHSDRYLLKITGLVDQNSWIFSKNAFREL